MIYAGRCATATHDSPSIPSPTDAEMRGGAVTSPAAYLARPRTDASPAAARPGLLLEVITASKC